MLCTCIAQRERERHCMGELETPLTHTHNPKTTTTTPLDRKGKWVGEGGWWVYCWQGLGSIWHWQGNMHCWVTMTQLSFSSMVSLLKSTSKPLISSLSLSLSLSLVGCKFFSIKCWRNTHDLGINFLLLVNEVTRNLYWRISWISSLELCVAPPSPPSTI